MHDGSGQHDGRGFDRGTGEEQDTVIAAPAPSIYRSWSGRPARRAPLWHRLAVPRTAASGQTSS